QDSKEAASLNLGYSQWAVTVREPALKLDLSFDTESQSSIERSRSLIVGAGRKLGDPSEVYNEARELTYRSAFLNLWSAFESFAREAVAELIKLFPSSLALLPDGKKPIISYVDLLSESRELSDIDALREALINSEIARVEGADKM